MSKPTIRTAALLVIAMLAVMSAAFAQYAPSIPPLRPIMMTPKPLPQQTAVPNALPSSSSSTSSQAMRGRFVPLSKLPPLPPPTQANTSTPTRRARPMAATGATIVVTRANTGANGNCANTSGTLYNIGCTVNWYSTGNAAPDTFQDYYIAPNVGNGQGGTAVGSSYTSATGATNTLTLSAEGTYVFATLDTSKNVWSSVVYITVGSSFQVSVYQDPYHTTETYQFDASTSGNAYIYGTNLTASDYYVVYIESTSVNPKCVFMAPSGTITSGQLCNVSNVTGVQAPGGALSVTWPITTALAAGTYSIIVYDKTLNERLGQVQVSVTGSNGYIMTLTPNDANANPSPSPLPAATPTPATIFAYDSANDRSTGGLSMTVTHAPSSTYIWSVTDPNGYSYASTSVTGSGTLSNTFNFSSFALSPGTYQPKTFSAALYDTVAKTVYASQTFQMYGYYVTPSLNGSAALSISQGGSTPATLKFTNSSAIRYGSDHADSFSKIIFTTGSSFNVTTGGQGIFAYLSTQSFAACAAPGCTTTATDTSGGSWNVTNICGNAGTNSTDECTVELDPVNSTTTLTPGNSVSVNLNFGNATGSSCSSGSTCTMYTSVLPAHGQTWSSIASGVEDAYLPVYIAAGNSLTGTASVALSGVEQPNYSSTTAETVEAHLYEPYTVHAHYHRSSPYAMTSSYYNILAFTVTNNSSKNEYVIAIGLPGSYASLGSIDNFALDPNLNTGSNGNWVIDTSCANASGTFGRKYLCLDGTGAYGPQVYVPKNGSTTIYLDMNAAPTSFAYTDWSVSLANPLVFSLTADPAKAATVPIGPGGAGFSIDALAYAQYSLDSSLMQANFNPSTTGSSAAASETVQITNTTTGEDPYPDYLDNVLVALPSGYTMSNVSVSTSGWSLLTPTPTTSGGYNYYWFSPCSNAQNSAANLPPTVTPLTARNKGLSTQCSSTSVVNALAPGSSLTFAATINGIGTSDVAALMYAHGANGNGWTQGKTFTLHVQAVSASAGFSAAGGYPTPAPVATNAVPAVGGNANSTYGNAYTYAVKNTSGSTNITSFAIIIPGTDISGVNATDSSGNTWVLTNTPPTLSGNTDGCTVTGYQSATTSGANGYIDIGGGSCALKPGDTINVNFDATGPQSQGDSYQFTMQNINGSGTLNSATTPGTTAAETWLGDSRVQVQLSIGLNLSMNPSNPGPGGSTPNVTCGGCAFSGTTVDLGTYGSSTTTNFTDLVNASVYITSSTAVTWNLSVQTNSNPARTPATPTNELLTWTDSANSSQSAGITFDVTSATVLPTGSSLQIAHGTSITTRSTPYDVLQDFQLNLGTETNNSSISTVTYTLIAN